MVFGRAPGGRHHRPAGMVLLTVVVASLAGVRGVAAQGEPLVPLGTTSYAEPLAWTAVALLIVLAGVFSMLTLGLMGLDVHGLEIVMAGSDPEDARSAERILPVRKQGNLLLCTLIFGNVAVISLTSILLSDLLSGLAGFLVATAAIVLLGEILPQALCSRSALKMGARAVPLVKALMVLFYPLAKPVALLLDAGLHGQELLPNCEAELVTMLERQVKQGIIDEEVGRTLRGALKYKSMSVKEAMTPVQQVFMISRKEVLGYETMAKVFKAGFSRVLVYDHDMQDIVGLLLAKDLLVVDHSAGIPVDTFLRFFGRPIESLPVETTTLGDVLALFKEGRSHMVLLTSQLPPSPVSDTAKTIKRGSSGLHGGQKKGRVCGIITLIDVLQKILGTTILDEKDKECELRRRMEERRRRRLMRSMSMGDGKDEEEEDEEEEEKSEWATVHRDLSEDGLGEEERRNRLLNATTWLSCKMKGLKEAAMAAAARSHSQSNLRATSSNGLSLHAGALGSMDHGPVSLHLAAHRPTPIQATGTPRAIAAPAASLLDLFHPTPQQGKVAQRRLEAMHLTTAVDGSVRSHGGNGGDHVFDNDDDEDEDGDDAVPSTIGSGSSINTTGAAAAGEEQQGGQEGQVPKPKTTKKKLKHKLRKLYHHYSSLASGGRIDLKNPEARADTAGALSQLIHCQQEQQQQQAAQAQAQAAAGGGGGGGKVTIRIEG